MTSDDEAPAMRSGALAGIRVVDVGRLVAGPFAGTLLAELGADVVKVEDPDGGDPLRAVGETAEPGRSCTWLTEARNKRSLTIDLSTDRGRDLLAQLITRADVLIENSRPGWLESMGFDDEARDALNPRLVTCRVSGYGQTGPDAALPGLDRQAVALSGIATLTGHADGPPLKPGVFLADYSTGLYAAFLVMCALRARDMVTGRGQVVDVGLFEFPFRMTGDWVSEFELTGRSRPRMGNRSEAVAPSDAYETADGVWLMIACSTDGAWDRMAEALAVPADTRAELRTGAARLAQRQEVNQLVADWVGHRPAGEVEAELRERAIPAVRFHEPDDILAHPQFIARHAVADADVAGRRVPVPAPAGRLTGTPAEVRWDGPPLGAHSDSVLHDWLDLDDTTISGLRAQGVV